LFAVNPTPNDAVIPVDAEAAAGVWRQLADAERFYGLSGHSAGQPVEPELFVPALGCGLWLCEG
jgi:hypothetical protein